MLTRFVPLLLSALLGGLPLFPGIAHAATVAAGANHTAVVTPDGTVWVWGSNGAGQLGDGTTTTRAVPTQLATLTDIVAVAAGGSHTLALKSDGTVYAWGSNTHGQLGNGSTTPSTSPVTANVTGIIAIAAGASHSVALASDGRVWVWGQNTSGQVGKGSTSTSESTPYMVNTLTSVTAIGAGGQHTLVVKSDGTVWGFGENGNGQLGIGNTTDQTSAAQMTSVADASAVAGGGSHSLILLSDGTVRAVGYSGSGQLGNGGTTQQTTSVAVSSLTDVVLVAAGQDHSVAVKSDGTFVAWGENGAGRLGDGTQTDRSTPTTIASLAGIGKAAAGGSHTLSVTTTGIVSTWGDDASSQLGDGTTTGRLSPIPISGTNYAWKPGTPLFSLIAGTYDTDRTVVLTCATPGATIHYTLDGATPTESDPSVTSGGSVVIDQTRTLKARAWNGTAPPSELTTAVYTMRVGTPSVSPFPGTYTTAQTVTLSTVTSGATLRYTTDGSTPTEASTLYTSPITVGTTTTIRAVGFRANWTSSITATAPYTMNFGTLAVPSFSPAAGTFNNDVSLTLSSIPGATIRYTTNGLPANPGSTEYTGPLTLTTTTTINARAYHPDYTVSANTAGTYTLVVATPTLTPTAGTYAAGQTVTVATATSGATITYTLNGVDPTQSDPVIASGGTLVLGNYTLKAKAWKTGYTASAVATASYAVTGDVSTYGLATGVNHSLAVRADGTAWSWGYNAGSLGDGTTTSRSLPGVVSGFPGAAALAGGEAHSLGVRTTQQVAAWGTNSSGQVGDGTTTQRLLPTSLAGLSDVVLVAAGASHTVALKADGSVVAWGVGGRVGDGTSTQRTSPVAVSGLTNVTAIAVGSQHSLALKSDGTVMSWGANGLGQLGDGTTTQRLAPVAVSGLTGVVAIAAGAFHSLAIKSDGSVVGWGSDTNGQLAQASYSQQPLPVALGGVTDAIAVAGGVQASYVLTTAGVIYAVGSSSRGELGNGSTGSLTALTAIAGLPAITRLASGGQHVLALTADASVWAWGRNDYGQLGDGTSIDRLAPVQIAGPEMAWRVATPVLSVPSGTYFAAQSVVVTCADASATLHYTLTGADPTTSDPVVTSGSSVSVPQSLTLKVSGWKSGAPTSVVSSATYELKVVTPVVSPASGPYGTPPSISLSTSTAGATFTYTTDGTEPTPSSTAYSTPFTLAQSTTVRARAHKTGWTSSDSGVASYWVVEGTVAVPVLTPAAGSYVDEVLVSMSTTTPGATIRYTLDGSDPTAASPVFAVPLVVRATTTVKARAYKSACAPSAVTSATYALDAAGATATPAISPGGGRFTTRQTVTITGPAGATLRYTTTSVDPTDTDTAITSGSTLVIDRSLVLKVRAWEAGATASAVRRADFVVTGALAGHVWHGIAVKSDESVWTWGSNQLPGLGDGVLFRTTPAQVATGGSDVATGPLHFLARKTDGTVVSWGNSSNGRLGHAQSGAAPAAVTGLTSVVAIAAGTDHSLAVKADGSVWAWGDNTEGQIGDGTTTQRSTPVQVTGLTGAIAVAAGNRFSLAVTSDGAGGGLVWAWGLNAVGQLADGTTVRRLVPTRVPLPLPAAAVTAGNDWGCARGVAGLVWCWGANASGQLGIGTTTTSLVPVEVRPFSTARAVSAGQGHTLGLTAEGALWSWGESTYGELGIAVDGPGQALAPVRSTAAWTPVLVAAGSQFSLAARADGTVWSVGRNLEGQLGNGSTTSSATWVAASGLSLADNTWLTTDTDGDGLSAWQEYLAGLDPLSADTNGDGLTDGAGTDGRHPDTDGDGLANWIEAERGTDPFRADTDGDGVADGADAFPLDPTRSQLPAPTPGDTTPPVITLIEPTSATPVPPL